MLSPTCFKDKNFFHKQKKIHIYIQLKHRNLQNICITKHLNKITILVTHRANMHRYSQLKVQLKGKMH